MRAIWSMSLVLLLGVISPSVAQDESSPPELGDARNSPLLSGLAHEAGKSVGSAHCEHSKLITQDADPLGKGAWQLQFNGSYNRSTQRWNPSGKKERRGRLYELSNQMVLTRGVSDDLDLAIGSGYSWLADDETGLRSGHGLTDLTVSAKWRFFENEEQWVALAYVPTLTIPTGKDTSPDRLGPSQEFWSLDTRFAVVKDWSERWSTNFDIGYEAVFGDPGASRGSFGANLALGYQFLHALQPELEFNYSHDFTHRDQDADLIAVTVGAVMPLSDLVSIRAGAQHGIAGRNVDQSTTILLSMDLNF